ncbi:hypothetical protein DIURU_005367 [Diutina rugosa]|uniref:XPA C-terminal domain-containing protein n=1 Tax=Diutina rugosa TaxID=5481 RepID=A0A642UG11_DIURU|nr:uncharacterized protein DIURU_005367 [Diutina rugosa]KAA8897134.1 hypothetical protein DIURU_005367 [Diutina rugosa]
MPPRPLSDAQRARIEENRKRALARQEQRGQQVESGPIISTFAKVENGAIKRSRIELSDDQRARIERNRQRALEIRRKRAGEAGLDTSVTASSSASSGAPAAAPPENRMVQPDDNIRLNKNQHDFVENKSRFQPPPIRRKDYIEYDFSTMSDSKGGFIATHEEGSEGGESLKDWKEKQERRPLREPAPPIDPTTAPKCFECDSIEIDAQLYEKFNARVCKQCKREHRDKYSLLTKTECREDYFLTEPELQDVKILPRIEKANPHGFSRMQLFLRYQVEEFAWKKWGGPDELDAEWERRQAVKLKRKEKRYQQELKEMRKKTRAEEYTRKLRNGEGMVERHVHDWSAPMVIDEANRIMKRRCIDCGMEMEEVYI